MLKNFLNKSSGKGSGKTSSAKKSDQPRINVYKKTAFGKLFSHAWGFVVWGILGVLALYLVFAMTIIRFVPAGSDIGLILVKNNTYKGGVVPSGEVVLINNLESSSNDTLSNLKNSFIPLKSSALIEVLAGPYGDFKYTSPGIVLLDGEPLEGVLPRSENVNHFERRFLKNEYIGLCVKGDCPLNELVIFKSDRIVGIPINESKFQKVMEEEFTFFPEQSGGLETEQFAQSGVVIEEDDINIEENVEEK